jgi:hypothetical protein
MLNASFCDLYNITGDQAIELQDRNMVLHGNPVTELYWRYAVGLSEIPAWVRTLEKVTYIDLEYCNVKEMKGGAFPASLEKLLINQQMSGLRLHPDSFEGLPELRHLRLDANGLSDDDMHPGLFANNTKLEHLYILDTPALHNFDAAALFPGGSQVRYSTSTGSLAPH